MSEGFSVDEQEDYPLDEEEDFPVYEEEGVEDALPQGDNMHEAVLLVHENLQGNPENVAMISEMYANALEQVLLAGDLVPSETPWASPLIFVPRK